MVDKNLHIMVGDITGNGIAVSPYVGTLAALFSLIDYDSPARALSEINYSCIKLKKIAESKHGITFTAVYLILYVHENKVRHSGYQQDLLIMRTDGKLELEETYGPILGESDSIALYDHEFSFEVGDGLFIKTDGAISGVEGEDKTTVMISSVFHRK